MKIWTLSKRITEVRNQSCEEGAFQQCLITLSLLGLESLVGKLKVDLNKGLTGVDLQERNDHFGSNFRPPMQPKSYFELLGEQFEDPMLRVLVVCGIVSIVVDMLLAEPEKRAYGK